MAVGSKENVKLYSTLPHETQGSNYSQALARKGTVLLPAQHTFQKLAFLYNMTLQEEHKRILRLITCRYLHTTHHAMYDDVTLWCVRVMFIHRRRS